MEKIGANANILVIGVTGNVGSGKTTLLSVLQKMGVSTLSVDTIIHNLYRTNKELINKIIRLLGNDVLQDKMLNRKKIAQKVFAERQLLITLEKLSMPYVLDEIYSIASTQKKNLAIEFPLLFEYSLEKLFDKTIFIKASKEICRDRSELKDVGLRNNRFLSEKEKTHRADITITNDSSIESFQQTIMHAMEGIIT